MEKRYSYLSEAHNLIGEGLDDLFLMTTADYPMNELLEVAKEVKKIIPNHMKFIANIGDFNDMMALKLKEVGFTGVYHIHRLSEGTDTDYYCPYRENKNIRRY